MMLSKIPFIRMHYVAKALLQKSEYQQCCYETTKVSPHLNLVNYLLNIQNFYQMLVRLKNSGITG